MIKKTIFVFNNTKPDVESYIYCHIQELDKIPNGSADEIICNCIDNLSYKDRQRLLTILVNKVKLDGLVVIQNTDLYLFAKYVMNNLLSIEQANEIILSSSSMVDDNDTETAVQKISNAKILDTIYDRFQRVVTIQRTTK